LEGENCIFKTLFSLLHPSWSETVALFSSFIHHTKQQHNCFWIKFNNTVAFGYKTTTTTTMLLLFISSPLYLCSLFINFIGLFFLHLTSFFCLFNLYLLFFYFFLHLTGQVCSICVFLILPRISTSISFSFLISSLVLNHNSVTTWFNIMYLIAVQNTNYPSHSVQILYHLFIKLYHHLSLTTTHYVQHLFKNFVS